LLDAYGMAFNYATPSFVSADATLTVDVPTIVTAGTAGVTLTLPSTHALGTQVMVCQPFPHVGPVSLVIPSGQDVGGLTEVTLKLWSAYPDTQGTVTLLTTVANASWVLISGRLTT
jgi:hypothetical protein